MREGTNHSLCNHPLPVCGVCKCCLCVCVCVFVRVLRVSAYVHKTLRHSLHQVVVEPVDMARYGCTYLSQ